MSKDRPRKIRKRRTTATVGGTTQSGFASRSMSDILKQGSDGDPKPEGEEKETGKKRGAADDDAAARGDRDAH